MADYIISFIGIHIIIMIMRQKDVCIQARIFSLLRPHPCASPMCIPFPCCEDGYAPSLWEESKNKGGGRPLAVCEILIV